MQLIVAGVEVLVIMSCVAELGGLPMMVGGGDSTEEDAFFAQLIIEEKLMLVLEG